MKRLLFIFGFFQTIIGFSQSNYTVHYAVYFGMGSLLESKYYRSNVKAALYVMGDSMSVYRMGKDKRELMKPYDISSSKMNKGVMRYFKDICHYEILYTGSAQHLISIPDNSNDWKLFRDTVQVGKWRCLHAVKGNVMAWYVPSMPANAGPAGYGGLPGLIVKLFDSEMNVLIEADKIEQRTPPMVYYPDELPIITHLEYFDWYVKPYQH